MGEWPTEPHPATAVDVRCDHCEANGRIPAALVTISVDLTERWPEASVTYPCPLCMATSVKRVDGAHDAVSAMLAGGATLAAIQ